MKISMQRPDDSTTFKTQEAEGHFGIKLVSHKNVTRLNINLPDWTQLWVAAIFH